MQNLKNNLSKYAIYLCLFVALIYIFSAKGWKREGKIIGSDVVSYYAYLPAKFIFNDIKLERQETFDKGLFWPESLPDGKKVIKTSMGMSMLYAPFFFGAHAMAKIMGLEAYGYSPIYKIGLLFSSLFYFFLGLFYLRKILKRYFGEQIVALTIIAIALGTNLIYYATIEATMSHVYNFGLINVFVWLTIRWFDKPPKLSSLMFLGFLSGLITLVRPSNIIVLFFFFLYGVYSFDTFTERFKLVFSKFHWFVLMGGVFFLVWIPQMIYWYSITGDLFVNSYPNERFYWDNPHFIYGLFSYRKGWLLYTPLMFFALLGIPFLFKQLKEFSWSIALFMLFSMYIIFSWWCWWYGGSFGMRSFIDYYGILAIPLALLFTQMWKYKKYFKVIVFSIVLFALVQNIFFVEKYKRSSLHWDSTTKASFWNSCWHLHPQQGYWGLLEKPDYQKALEGIDAIVKESD